MASCSMEHDKQHRLKNVAVDSTNKTMHQHLQVCVHLVNTAGTLQKTGSCSLTFSLPLILAIPENLIAQNDLYCL